MPSLAVKERLAQDVGQWVTDGLIPAETAAVLRERWDQPGLGLTQIIRAFGFAGGLFAFFGLLGLVAALAKSEAVGALLLAAVGGGLLAWGVSLSLDPRGRWQASSKVVLALGFSAFASGVGVAGHGAGLQEETLTFVTGLFSLPLAFALAYKYRNPFLLVLGLLGAFHWIGSWSRMIGRSSYALSVQDPRLMCVAALAAAAVGVAHQRLAREQGPRFHLVWQGVGLTYLNLSLLILTIHAPGHGEAAWIGVWALAGVLQIVAGARLQSGAFTGFGVTALAVNLYTRYFERFWDGLDAGLFFLLGGALLFAAGSGAEWASRKAARQ